jgi:5-deoxy-glucuronate isomerase
MGRSFSWTEASPLAFEECRTQFSNKMTDLHDPINWKYKSPELPGFHIVVSPDNSACRITWMFRLNLPKGQTHHLSHKELELNGLVVSGKALIRFRKNAESLVKKDSFYLPAGEEVSIQSEDDLIMFVGGGMYEGLGDYYVRHYDKSMPIGDIRQIHGDPPYKREVFMTIGPTDNASRLICGITEGEAGKWTSWPPHQHTADLEEIYCYFDIPPPRFALHLSSRKAGVIEAAHPVSTGDFVVIPEGYHPTVGIPGIKSTYFWVMAAHSRNSRRYDLAINDPNFDDCR